MDSQLSQIYKVLSAKPKIKTIDDNPKTLEIKVKHKNNFCPIGGDCKSKERATFINENICIPYTIGFLNELDHTLKFEALIKNCIALNNSKSCYYILKMSKKTI